MTSSADNNQGFFAVHIPFSDTVTQRAYCGLWCARILGFVLIASGRCLAMQDANLKIDGVSSVQFDGNSVLIVVDAMPESNELVMPRLANVVERIYWQNEDDGEQLDSRSAAATMTLTPDVNAFRIKLTHRPKRLPATLVIQTDGQAEVFGADIRVNPDGDGIVSFPACKARVNGRNLRFEPQPHKNTVGYWSVKEDFAEWNFDVTDAGDYEVEIQQGCGSGHGGSTVELQTGQQALAFTVLETGHFQNFRWRHLGRIKLAAGSGQTLRLIPQSKPGGAVMDVREIRLIPSSKDSHKYRKAGVNADGTRADGKEVHSDRPNVLVVLADDLGTLDAGCFGSRDLFTPRIDGLAHGGVRFTRAYAHTVCCPARAMLLTGRHPQRSGINSWTQGRPDSPAGDDRNINLPAEEVTLAEALHDAGYRTGLFGKWHLGAAKGADPTTQGFDQFFGFLGGFIDNDRHFFLHGAGYHDLYAGDATTGIQPVQLPGKYFPTIAVQHMKSFLADHVQQYADRPFFVYLPLNLPHYPEQSLQKFAQFYSNHAMPRQSYGQAVSTTDELLGMALDALDGVGVRENTIVLFTSDNGHSAESYAIKAENHASGFPVGHNYGANGGGGNTGPWRGNKNTFYEGGIRTPALLQFAPQLPAGKTIDAAVNLSDWMPTLLKMCKVATPENLQLDGINLTSYLTSDQTIPDRVMHWQWQDRWAVREGNWKLLGKGNQSTELVNLSDESPESINHINQQPDTVKRLLSAHMSWHSDVTGE